MLARALSAYHSKIWCASSFTETSISLSVALSSQHLPPVTLAGTVAQAAAVAPLESRYHACITRNLRAYPVKEPSVPTPPAAARGNVLHMKDGK